MSTPLLPAKQQLDEFKLIKVLVLLGVTKHEGRRVQTQIEVGKGVRVAYIHCK